VHKVLVSNDLGTRYGVTRNDVRWASTYAELDGERKDSDLYWFWPLNNVIPYVQLGVLPCIGLFCMMILQGGASASLYIVQREDALI
jgi:hypothetical protein